MLCSLLKFNRRFGGIYCLHLQDKKISQQETSVKAGGKQHQLNFNGLQGIMSQKMVLSITTAVRTSNPTVSL
jgi:hypothetical protein